MTHPAPRRRLALHTKILLGLVLGAVAGVVSNIYAREGLRHHSHIAPVAKATLAGLGVAGYGLAIDGLAALASQRKG